jgi:transposase, IS6 family
VRVKGQWVYLYRAVDSSGATIDFLLSAKRDAATAQRFLSKALSCENHPEPRVINSDKHAAYPPAIAVPIEAPWKMIFYLEAPHRKVP